MQELGLHAQYSTNLIYFDFLEFIIVDSNLLSEAISLTLFGMGFVFVFLALMVVMTSFMSAFVLKLQPFVPSASVSTIQTDNLIDEDTKSIIEKAIKMHTGV